MKKTNFLTTLCIFLLLLFVTTSCDEENYPTTPQTLQEAPPFDPEKHHPNQLHLDFIDYPPGYTKLGLAIEPPLNKDGQIQIGIESFDKLAIKYNFTELYFWREFRCKEKLYQDVWLGYLIHRGFTLTLKDSTVIQDALNALLNDKYIVAAKYIFISNEVYPPFFDENLHLPNELWITLNPRVAGFIDFGFEPEKNENGQVQIGYPSFDEIAIKYDITDMKQLYFFSPDNLNINTNFFDDCRYNDFLITIKDNTNIRDVYYELRQTQGLVLRVTYNKKQ